MFPLIGFKGIIFRNMFQRVFIKDHPSIAKQPGLYP